MKYVKLKMERIMYLVQEIFYIVNHQKKTIVMNALKIIQYIIIILKNAQK